MLFGVMVVWWIRLAVVPCGDSNQPIHFYKDTLLFQTIPTMEIIVADLVPKLTKEKTICSFLNQVVIVVFVVTPIMKNNPGAMKMVESMEQK